MPLVKRRIAEFIGTFWLVLSGGASAVRLRLHKIGEGTAFPLGIGLVGVSLAFGLTVLTAAYGLGHITGGHFNLCSFLWFMGGQTFSRFGSYCHTLLLKLWERS